jgi:hypothetical protein
VEWNSIIQLSERTIQKSRLFASLESRVLFVFFFFFFFLFFSVPQRIQVFRVSWDGAPAMR